MPALSEERQFRENDIIPLHDRPTHISIAGIDILIRASNSMTLRAYDTSLIVPIEIFNMKSDQYDLGKGYTGKKPFIISIYLMADGAGATFTPWETSLHFDKDGEQIYPLNIYNTGQSVQCGESRKGIVASAHDPIAKSVAVSLTNKNLVDANERDYKANWSCLRLTFDVVTPEPNKKFHLKLGEIVTPEGQRIRPTIYFSPVTYKQFVH